jgi:signal transduction histidine kinase
MSLCVFQLKAWMSKKFGSKRPAPNNHSELIERLSHELRTSLTGIVGYSEFVESSSTEPMVNFTAKIIRESSQGLSRASNSFFDLHRLELGELKVDCVTFSISELIRDVVRVHQREALEKDVKLIFTGSAETFLFDMYADASKVRQLIDALIFGGIQSAGKGMSIQVDISLDGDQSHLRFMVIALDSEFNGSQIELAQEFWCNENYRFRLQEGPGVELALAKALIYFLQGQAEYRAIPSEAPRLIVTLPMRYIETKVRA